MGGPSEGRASLERARLNPERNTLSVVQGVLSHNHVAAVIFTFTPKIEPAAVGGRASTDGAGSGGGVYKVPLDVCHFR
ncbi:hypothetical protein evm_003828 [Chilo suppressalis]|nr:hypothetical protein evm_003828 [Chilo suppressalis]